jgi:methyl-accepting chemotaxis protein
MRRLWCQYWNRLRFSHQLLLIVGITFSLLSIGLLVVLTALAQQEAQHDLKAELLHELISLPPIVADLVVVGDYASLEQLLDNQVKKQQIERIAFVDTKGAKVEAQSAIQVRDYPLWFDAFFNIKAPTDSMTVRVGSKSYGTLEVSTAAVSLSNRLWQHFLTGLLVSVLAWLIIWILLWLIIRKGLEPLIQIHHHAIKFAQGDLDNRIKPAGAQELRYVIEAINESAQTLQNQHSELIHAKRKQQKQAVAPKVIF